jgi:hypothetical protein
MNKIELVKAAATVLVGLADTLQLLFEHLPETVGLERIIDIPT